MTIKKKSGEKPRIAGEYEERGPRGGLISKPRQVTIDSTDRLPPTREPNRTWVKIGKVKK